MDDHMTHYEHTLVAMERLLNAVGERHWASWIREDIDQWKKAADPAHHLSAYGGMGSFNDVTICRANQHEVSAVQEPWANTLFEWLKALCYYFARHPNQQATSEILIRAVGRDEPSLAAFVGGDKAPASMKGLVGSDRTVGGWRCLACGHSEISGTDVDYFIASEVIPRVLFPACVNKTLDELVDKALAVDIRGLEESRRELICAAEASGIIVRDREGWMWDCPKCGQRSSAVGRWRYLHAQGRLQLSEDCLPVLSTRWWRRCLQAMKRLLVR